MKSYVVPLSALSWVLRLFAPVPKSLSSVLFFFPLLLKRLSLPYTSSPLVLACLVVGAVSTASPRAAQAVVGWISTCNYSHTLNDDPIVFPRMPGASHLHDFVGNMTTDAFSTLTSLDAGGTTCAQAEDGSAYWIPATYQNGVHRTPSATSKNALFYYRRGAVHTDTPIRPFPPGLRFVYGNGHAASPAENPGIGQGRIYWKCGGGSSTHLTAPPTSCPGENLISLVFVLPQCWNGTTLDSPDHASHMTYTVSGRCPDTHPVALPQITAYWRIPTDSAVGTITYASGPYYTAHMDFFNAWDGAALQALVTDCINASVDCGVNPVP